jgi:opacity protein-like surface antigen
MLGVGASYQIGQSFTLAADYEMRQYKDKKSTITVSGNSSSSLLSASNEDLNQFRIGAEYLIVMSGGVIPLRAGFRTVPTVLANYEWNRDSLSYFPSGQVSGTGYSAGTGFISNNFALDFAYSHEQYDEQTWKDAGVTYYTTNYNTDRFSLSLIVYF